MRSLREILTMTSPKQTAWLEQLRAQIRLEAYMTGHDWHQRLSWPEAERRFDAKISELQALVEQARRERINGAD